MALPGGVCYSSIPTASSSSDSGFFHDLNIKRVNMDSNLSANREHIGAVYQPFIVVGKDFHFIVDSFENQMGNDTFNVPSSGFTRSMSSGRMTASTGLLVPNPVSTHGNSGTDNIDQLIAYHDGIEKCCYRQ